MENKCKLMEKFVESLFEAHQNPIVRLNTYTPGSKLYISQNWKEEKCIIEKNTEILKDTLNFMRVDRRWGRSLGEWLEDKKLVRVTRKYYQKYGFEDKTGKYLYPEEALFLLETNRLEITRKNVPLSIQQAFTIMLKDDIYPLSKYEVYKDLALVGYKFLKPAKINNNEVEEPEEKKIKLNLDSDKVKGCDISDLKSDVIPNAPASQYDFKICSPRKNNIYEVQIINNKELDPKLGLLNGGTPKLFGIALPDNVAFYRFIKINLPNLTEQDASNNDTSFSSSNDM